MLIRYLYDPIRLNERDNHLNDVTNNILRRDNGWQSNSKERITISCVNDDCLDDPMAQCLRCSKYYCYEHIQLCLQIHPNEIEIIRPMKNMINMM